MFAVTCTPGLCRAALVVLPNQTPGLAGRNQKVSYRLFWASFNILGVSAGQVWLDRGHEECNRLHGRLPRVLAADGVTRCHQVTGLFQRPAGCVHSVQFWPDQQHRRMDLEVERLVQPAVIEPLRSAWAYVQGAAVLLANEGRHKEAVAEVRAFHHRLCSLRVLDPACGSGNFLYVALEHLKRLEGEVLNQLADLGESQSLLEAEGLTVDPHQFLGLEINPRAAAIAELVLWIGYLQWHFRTRGSGLPPSPILKDFRNIACRDAVLAHDGVSFATDERGVPLTRWDGKTTKPHPVTGEPVPDESAQVPRERYANPRPASWPDADYVIGNPPFIGASTMRAALGDGYTEALRAAWPLVPESADFVMFWWHRAAIATSASHTARMGFITTKSITQAFSRAAMAKHMADKRRVSLVFAIPNHPWIDEADGADVRVAFTVAAPGKQSGRKLEVVAERPIADGAFEVDFSEAYGLISPSLRTEVDLQQATALKANANVSSVGFQLTGKGFVIGEELLSTLSEAEQCSFVFTLLGAREIVQTRHHRKVIDVCEIASESDLRKVSPAIYQHLLHSVKPERDVNARKSVREKWWVYGEARNTFRPALKGVGCQIVTPLTAKHRVFVIEPVSTRADSTCVCIALDDGYNLGVLSSRIHLTWALANGGRLGVGDDPRYLKGECFDPFPFPADIPEPLKGKIRVEAEALDALRKRVLESHGDLTLTKLYNVLEALREGRALTDAERDMHDRGLITLIRQHHDAIDALVAEAYGWPADLSDEEVLTRLVALNKTRAAEEAKGLIRWLRPEFQAPDYKAPVTQTLDLGEAASVLPDNVIPWPGSLPEQVSAVQTILSAAGSPLAPQDVARAFKGKRAATVRPVLDALAGIGMARRLKDGRYAA